MRILFAAVPGMGHVYSMVPLATALLQGGHDVRWALNKEYHARLEALGFKCFDCGISEAERWAGMAERGMVPKRPEPATPQNYAANFGDICAPVMYADLRRVTGSWGPDLFVHDFNEFASAPIAASFGRPHVTHGFGLLARTGALAAAAPFVESLWDGLGLTAPPLCGAFDGTVVSVFPAGLESTPALGDLRYIRGAEPGSAPAPDWWPRVPDRPVVYVSFGTLARTAKPLETALAGLADLEVSVVATRGAAGHGEEIRIPDNATVVDFVSEQDVLHLCSAAVLHAGAGTFLKAVAHGLPQVYVPQGADQFFNSAAGEQAGFGLTILPEDLTAAAIRDAVLRVLAEQSFRARASAWAAKVAEMPAPTEVATQVVSLVS